MSEGGGYVRHIWIAYAGCVETRMQMLCLVASWLTVVMTRWPKQARESCVRGSSLIWRAARHDLDRTSFFGGVSRTCLVGVDISIFKIYVDTAYKWFYILMMPFSIPT
jgi:hypothetical protein